MSEIESLSLNTSGLPLNKIHAISEPQDNIQHDDELAEPIDEPITKDDPIAKAKLIKQITAYKCSRLSKYLKTFDLSESNLEAQSVAELETLLRQIRFELGTMGSGAITNAVADLAVNAIEQVGTGIGLRLQGFSAAIQKQEQFYDIVTEIQLKHACVVQIEPEARLIMMLTGTALAIHNGNVLNDMTQEAMKQKINPEQYSDL